ncbi:hypothetical protein CDL12_23433 [Handroanthus impetiginosus]|uniref:C2H2-type domain-containing protein n=1 Tax=Handroanthus impetiginosus TaxID=429701 RepID=A0A2G9GFH1_9LAMI|nr:hypothetical protein CDL12_23433 [Handroanthus impetiginosus]
MMKNSLEILQNPPMEENMSNLTSASNEASVSSSNKNDNGVIYPPQYNFPPMNTPQDPPPPIKKKRNQPGHPGEFTKTGKKSTSILFVCEICNKGFQRDQNLQLHRRGHNLPWKLKQRTSKEIRKKVYVCPEISCVHHDPSRALGDLTGIKKHFCRKHGEKKWKCDKCSKKYAVQSDWKAHSKTCGTREYRCDCGTLFSRRDSFITHRAFCDALAEESARSITGNNNNDNNNNNNNLLQVNQLQNQFINANELPFQIKKEQQNFTLRPEIPPWLACTPTIGPGPGPPTIDLTAPSSIFQDFQQNHHHHHHPNPNPNSGPTTLQHPYHPPPSPHISATALLQKAAQMGAKSSTPSPAGMFIRPHQAVAHVSAGSSDCGTTGFGLNLSSRDEFIKGLASYGNKAATVTGGSTETGGASSAGGTINPPPSSSLFHQMMMNNPGFDQASSFDDMGFGDQESLDNFHATLDQFSRKNAGKNENGGGNCNHNEGMTRDFLGLRPLSQSEIAGLSNCMNNNGANEVQNHTVQKSWQG